MISSQMEGNDPAKEIMTTLKSTNLKIYSNDYNIVYQSRWNDIT